MADFIFDSRNRLIQASNTVYRYDVENQRIGVNRIQYVVNSQPVLSQVLVKEESGEKTFYVYGLGLIGQESNGEYLSYHFDFRGSTVALTDSSSQVMKRFQYSPYGLQISDDASITPFLFNGMYGVMSDGNGLYYMRARFYNPDIRRFVNQDILFGEITEGQTLNRYAFVTGKPVSLIDPFGLAQEEVDRAADIVKTFLPHIYNDMAMPTIGDISENWFFQIRQYFGYDEETAGYTNIFGYITINRVHYSTPFFFLLNHQRPRIIGKRRLRIKQNIKELLRTVIHEYIHSSDVIAHSPLP